MSFELTAEQKEFKATVEPFFKEFVTSQYLRKRLQAPWESDPAFWEDIESLGFDEYFREDGSFVELAIISELAGSTLVPEPLIERLFAGPFCQSRLPRTKDSMTGSASVGFFSGSFSRSGDRCTGSLELVLGASNASHLLCFSEGPTAPFLIALDQTGVSRSSCSALDILADLVSIKLENVACTALPPQECSLALMYRLLKASELSGICKTVVGMTKEYVSTRKQFGTAIGSFQAVRHALVDMYVQAESLDSLCLFAVWSAEHSPEQFTLAGLSAIDYACSHTAELIEAAIQLHGGIGFTWEFDLHLYLRRAKSYAALFGLQEQEQELLIQSALAS